MDRYGWLALAGLGWAVLVGAATAIYARRTFARRGWTEPLKTRAFDRIQRTQSSFEAISRVPVRMPEAREAEPVLAPVVIPAARDPREVLDAEVEVEVAVAVPEPAETVNGDGGA